MSRERLRIMVFTWSPEEKIFCESLDENKVEEHRSKEWRITKYLRRGYQPCVIAKFFEDVLEKINSEKPEIIIFNLQNVNEYGYVEEMIKEELRVLGFDKKPETTLKIVYPRVSTHVFYKVSNRYLKENLSIKSTTKLVFNLYSAMVYIDIGNRRLAIANVDNEYSVPYISRYSTSLVMIKRMLTGNNFRLNSVIENLRDRVRYKDNSLYERVVSNPEIPGKDPDVIIIAGKLNYYNIGAPDITPERVIRILKSRKRNELIELLYKNSDSLKLAMDLGDVIDLDEGVDNEGIKFAPTCIRNKSRPEKCFTEEGYFDSSCWKTEYKDVPVFPSWCQRILYGDGKERHPDEEKPWRDFFHCLEYNKFPDYPEMQDLTDSMVYSIFELTITV